VNRWAQTNDIIIEDGGFASDSEVVKVRAAGSNSVDVVDDVSDKIAQLLLRRGSRSKPAGPSRMMSSSARRLIRMMTMACGSCCQGVT